jgi:mannose-6-phosphate isomerase-like protein (cupin superfamily)
MRPLDDPSMLKTDNRLPGRSPGIREAELVGASTGAIGGLFWDALKITKERPLPEESLARFNYLVQGIHCTISLNRVRKEIPLHIHKFNDEMQYYLEGKGKFRIGREWCSTAMGKITYIPKGTIHGGPIYEPVTLLAVFTPQFDIQKPDRVFVDENGIEYQ